MLRYYLIQKFREKLKGFHDSTTFVYEPIIKNREHLLSKFLKISKFGFRKYFLPYQKIRIGYPESNESDDHDTKMTNFCKSYDDEYFKYTSFKYSLFKNFEGIIQELPFDSFDEFTSYVKQGTNMRIIVQPTLWFKKSYDKAYNKKTLIYYIRLDVSKIEIK